jgi:uncharacterized protein YrrD
MDRKAREIIGLPVVTLNRGTRIYDIEDMIIDPERKQVLALVVSQKALFQSARAIPFGRIQAIGQDAVIVPDGKAVLDVDRDPVLRRLDNNQVIRGLRVLTDDGRKLGAVDDMLVDDKTGEIKGFHISMGGGVLNVTQGTRWLPAERVSSMGLRVLYVPADYAAEFDQQSGGWAGALDQAGEGLRSAGAKANVRLENWGAKAQEGGARFNEQLGQFGDQMRETLPQRATSFAVGKTAHTTVNAQDGTVIVNEGEVITQDAVDAAKKENRVPQLLMSAGMGQANRSMDSIGNEAAGWEDMRSEAKDLWQRITGTYNRTVDQTDEKFMEKRIKHALGRPATRVILDASDNVILNTGDIITNRAVQAARAADVLDILVDSVYAEKPKLSLEDLKAPRSGDASLETLNGEPQTAASKPRRSGETINSQGAVPPA